MQQDDSDSSDDGRSAFTTTNVLLGYASEEPTGDSFSQLGGLPTWPESDAVPTSSLAKCKTCNGMTVLLLQLYADLPEHFQGHERRLYVFSCNRKACRRKEGSMRVIRGTKIAKDVAAPSQQKEEVQEKDPNDAPTLSQPEPTLRLGDSIFSSSFGAPTTKGQNPFAKHNESKPEGSINTTQPSPSHPDAFNFHTSPSTSQPTHTSDTTLPVLFADKVRIVSPLSESIIPTAQSKIPWAAKTDLPPPYLSYHLDADYETFDPIPNPSIQPSESMKIDSADTANDIFDKEAFESSIDKTFQKFADRLAQNPEQVLRYEFGGLPLLYSTTDAVGRMFAVGHGGTGGAEGKVKVKGGAATKGMPRCGNCGGKRVFEVQLCPQAIAELEVEEEGLEGMEWGSVLVGVCEGDCGEKGVGRGKWGWVEEWVGVQWEEFGKVGRL